MSTRTTPQDRYTDEYGIERVNKDEPGLVDKLRDKHDWFDHLMRMNERFGAKGGNQLSAGITYFSVLSIFPIAMLVFGIAGVILAGNPEVLTDIQNRINDAARESRPAAVDDGTITRSTWQTGRNTVRAWSVEE